MDPIFSLLNLKLRLIRHAFKYATASVFRHNAITHMLANTFEKIVQPMSNGYTPDDLSMRPLPLIALLCTIVCPQNFLAIKRSSTGMGLLNVFQERIVLICLNTYRVFYRVDAK
jgi:hypothetical protein